MERETFGTVIDVSEQWWFKLNTKALRTHSPDGAIFPHVVRVRYTVNGKEYTCRKWFSTGTLCPAIGQTIKVRYADAKPSKAHII